MEVSSNLLCALSLAITEQSQVGEARRAAATLTNRLGFGETESGQVSIVVTEMAKNLVLHAQQGELILRPLQRGERIGLEILSLDRGPGMVDIARCLEDGYSTAGTPGNGMGAIQRLSSEFEAYSQKGAGTAILMRHWLDHGETAASTISLQTGVVSLPAPGETVCGDGWFMESQLNRSLFAVVDGLGHGPHAAEAAREALRIVRESAEQSPERILEDSHAALRSTRGAAMAVAEIDPQRGEVRFAGVGNISASLVSLGVSRSMMSHNGTLGHQLRKLQQLSYPWSPELTLIMHSDGLATQWRLEDYPGLLNRDPSLVAGVLYRDFKRGRDDVTVLAARSAEPRL